MLHYASSSAQLASFTGRARAQNGGPAAAPKSRGRALSSHGVAMSYYGKQSRSHLIDKLRVL